MSVEFLMHLSRELAGMARQAPRQEEKDIFRMLGML